MREMALLEQVLIDAKKGGVRMNESPLPSVENITNWDMQSTIFLSLQIMGSVGKSPAHALPAFR